MDIGQKIQELRKKNGLSQEELGNKISVARQTVSKWELNETLPDTENILKLCTLFDVTPNNLLGTEEKKDEERKAKTKEHNYLREGIICLVSGVLTLCLLVTLSMTIPSRGKSCRQVNPGEIYFNQDTGEPVSPGEVPWLEEGETVEYCESYTTFGLIPFLNTYYLHWAFAGGVVLIIVSVDRFVRYKKLKKRNI